MESVLKHDFFGQSQMSHVRRIKGPAKYSDFQNSTVTAPGGVFVEGDSIFICAD